MPPLATSAEKIKWHEDVFFALHALMMGAILNVLVFVQMAAGRSDNTSQRTSATPPSSEDPRPDVFIYLLLKGFQVSLPMAWFILKKVLDEFALFVGAGTMAVLLSTVTDSFTYFVALPVLGIMLLGRFLFGEAALEWLYVKLLQLRKCFYLSGGWVRWVFAKAVGFLTPTLAQNNEIEAAVEHVRAYWDNRVHAAVLRAREEKVRKNQEDIAHKNAIDAWDNATVLRSTNKGQGTELTEVPQGGPQVGDVESQ